MIVAVSAGEAAAGAAVAGGDDDGTAGGQQQRGALLALPDAMLSEVLGEFFFSSSDMYEYEYSAVVFCSVSTHPAEVVRMLRI